MILGCGSRGIAPDRRRGMMVLDALGKQAQTAASGMWRPLVTQAR